MFDGYKFTLASQSPRRRELLASLDIDFTVEPSKDEKEAYSDDIPAFEVPEFLARHKSESFHRALDPKEVLITADTLVFLEDGTILGKPKDRDDAIAIIKSLSGRRHYVLTGVVLRTSEDVRSFTEKTDVHFKELSDEEITYYVDNYKPFDKAGAYGIQEWIGSIGITAIEGSFHNVVGLPVQRLYAELCSLCK
jgi:MAF protein